MPYVDPQHIDYGYEGFQDTFTEHGFSSEPNQIQDIPTRNPELRGTVKRRELSLGSRNGDMLMTNLMLTLKKSVAAIVTQAFRPTPMAKTSADDSRGASAMDVPGSKDVGGIDFSAHTVTGETVVDDHAPRQVWPKLLAIEPYASSLSVSDE
jgi:hypothetical protein